MQPFSLVSLGSFPSHQRSMNVLRALMAVMRMQSVLTLTRALPALVDLDTQETELFARVRNP